MFVIASSIFLIFVLNSFANSLFFNVVSYVPILDGPNSVLFTKLSIKNSSAFTVEPSFNFTVSGKKFSFAKFVIVLFSFAFNCLFSL